VSSVIFCSTVVFYLYYILKSFYFLTLHTKENIRLMICGGPWVAESNKSMTFGNPWVENTDQKTTEIINRKSTTMKMPPPMDPFGQFEPKINAVFSDQHVSFITNQMAYPIDCVFTWVDATDEHTRRRISYTKKEGGVPQDNSINRYDSFHELRYAIRSLYQFAPWVRQVFIVVDDLQRPDWLVSDSHNLSIPIVVVKHSDMYGETFRHHLPTFNSQSIECHLHRILNLSEQFIYFNDDMFLGAPCVPDDFFSTDGKPRYIFNGAVPNGPKRKGMSQHAMAWVNNRMLLDLLFPKKKTASRFPPVMEYPSHQAVPMIKSSFEQAWKHSTVQRGLWQTSESRFRKSNNIYFIGFLIYFNIRSGLAVKGRRNNIYVEITDNTKLKPAFRKIIQERPKQFCLNDCVNSARIKIGKQLLSFMEHYFPHPSVAEITAAGALLGGAIPVA
jgi:hypothetical protein